MFKAKKKLESLQEKYDRLQEKCKEYQAENEALRECIFKANNGEYCKGGYCESCKNSIDGGYVEYVTSKGNVISIGDRTICKFAIPCTKFERED